MRLTFDRGTLLCLDAPPGLKVADLPGVLWDARVGAYRAPACRYADILARLHAQGEPVIDEARRSEAALPRWDEIALRPYQQAALAAWELSGRRGVIALPTGSGKTRVALAAVAAHQAAALCMVPTRVLLAQWCQELARVYSGPIGCLGDGERVVHPITVSTFESAYRHMAELGNRFGMLVIDEVHHFGAGVRDEALEMAIAPWRLGLSATPPTEAAAIRLAQLVGPTVYELAIGDLTGTFLAAYDLVVLPMQLTSSERGAYEADASRFRPLCRQYFRLHPLAAWSDFVRAAQQSEDGRQALAAWRRCRRLLAYTQAKARAVAEVLKAHRVDKVLVFTPDNETAYAIARTHLVMPLTCDIGRKERAEALERFKNSELTVLVSSRVLNEGLDVPEAGVAIVVGGSQGEREHVQRVGRLLRPAPGKRAIIYELVTTGTGEVDQAARRRAGLDRRRSVERQRA